MKRLVLMRHAKSDWSGATSDHDRPLNARGRASATALGEWLRAQKIAPDTVLCSTATRAAETLKGLALGPGTDVRFTRDLYLADPETILATLRAASGDTVVIIGHNPGIGTMAGMIIETLDDGGITDYPTGATLVATFNFEDWADVKWRMGTMDQFVVPRDLPAPQQ
jgi:phosphohistidine phosphatase